MLEQIAKQIVSYGIEYDVGSALGEDEMDAFAGAFTGACELLSAAFKLETHDLETEYLGLPNSDDDEEADDVEESMGDLINRVIKAGERKGAVV
jgi:hypothetical protein